MSIKPLLDRVVLQVEEAEEKTDCQFPFFDSGSLMQYSLFKIASSAPGIFLNRI